MPARLRSTLPRPLPRQTLPPAGSECIRLALASLLMAGLVLTAFSRPAWGQTAPAASASPASSAATVAASAARKPAASPSRPSWKELTPAQHTALAPLAGTWDQLTEAHKRKWIALAANFSRLPAAEQAKLHSRMTEWAALSPQQRAQARLNFGEAQQVSADEKRAKWEAYQALTPEERRKLADDARAKRPATTAAAVKPVPPQKLASVPRNPNDDPKAVRIQAGPASEPASAAGTAGTPN